MKKFAIVIILLLALTMLYAESEKWTSIGAGYGIITSELDNGEFTNNDISFNLNILEFWAKMPVGLYGNVYAGMPLNVKAGNTEYEKTSFPYTAGVIFGPGFTLPLGKTANLYLGAGVHFGVFSFKGEDSTRMLRADLFVTSIGFGGGLGLKLNLGSMYLDIGSTVKYDFYPLVTSSDNSSAEFKALGFRPYVGIGFIKQKG